MLCKPDERVKDAFKRLAPDADFSQIMAWLEFSLAELDQANRSQMDGVVMRQTQGGAQAIDEILGMVRGRNRAIAKPMVTSRTG